MKYFRLLFVWIVCLSATNCSKNDEVTDFDFLSDNPLQSGLDLSIDHHFRSYIQNRKHIGLSIAILDSDSTSFYNYGETHKGSGKLPTSESLYEIGSITKTFTAAVITQLLVDNDIPVETPVSTLLPREVKILERNGVEIQLLHLLNHTSGLPAVPNDILRKGSIENPYRDYSFQMMMDYLNDFELKDTPGEKYEYSNLGYALLGLIVSSQLGVSIDTYIEDIVEALGMDMSGMEISQVLDSELCMGAYTSNGRDGDYFTWNDWACIGGLYSNTKDLTKYARFHFKNNSELPQLLKVVEINKQETFSNGSVSLGRAWHLKHSENSVVMWHSGGTGGFTSMIFIEPDQEKALVVLVNNAQVEEKLLPNCASFLREFLDY